MDTTAAGAEVGEEAAVAAAAVAAAAAAAKEKQLASASQPTMEVRIVREVGGSNTWPMLTRTNYGEWAVHMKWKLRARRWWAAVETGNAGEDAEVGIMEALMASTPSEFHEAIRSKNTAKEAWDMLMSFRLGSDRAKKTKAQQLRRFDDLRFKPGEAVEDFALQLQSIASQLATYGKPVDDEDVVAKLLRVVPAKYTQLALSIETMLDLSTMSLEDVTGQLHAVEDRTPPEKEKPKLLLMEEWSARMKEKHKTGKGSSHGSGDHGGSNGGK
jgi:hypothetical protein